MPPKFPDEKELEAIRLELQTMGPIQQASKVGSLFFDLGKVLGISPQVLEIVFNMAVITAKKYRAN